MGKDTCYYDGRCGFCRRSRRILMALDWLDRLEFVDLTSVPEAELPVSVETALAGMPMRTSDGRVLVGFKAIRRALQRTPLGLPVALLLYVPGLNWLGARAYAWIATHRRRDAVCSVEGGCVVNGVNVANHGDGAVGRVEGRPRPADTAL